VELLDIARDAGDAAITMQVRGEVDSSTVDGLGAELTAAVAEAQTHPARTLIVDLNGVTYFGSAGLNALLDVTQRGETGGVAVRLVATNAEVVRPIEVTGLDHILRLHRSVDEAQAPSEDRR